MKNLETVAEEAFKLTLTERVTLAESLLLSIGETDDIMVDSCVLDEAERRLAELRNGNVKPVPAAEVLARARAAIQCRD
jgi:putative addiction module component (TIGR02574 family)